jgi:hypothetical protein
MIHPGAREILVMAMPSIVLRLAAVVFIAVGLLHFVLGLGADIMLGAKVPPEVVRDPVLDSQNRFYGTAFALYGVLLALGAADIKRHSATLQCCFWCFFAGGLARLVSAAIYGKPSIAVIALAALEIFPPPLLSLWLHRAVHRS